MSDSKKVVTCDESYEIFRVLTKEELSSLFSLGESLSEEYKENGSLSLDSIVPILGKCPIIPLTHDMDAMLEAADEKARYGDKVKAIENFVEYGVQHNFF